MCETMTDKERLEELTVEISNLRKHLQSLVKEKQALKTKLRTECLNNQPFQPNRRALFFEGKSGSCYLYVRYDVVNGDRKITYYRGPLYREDGKILGKAATRKMILDFTDHYKKMGATEIFYS